MDSCGEPLMVEMLQYPAREMGVKLNAGCKGARELCAHMVHTLLLGSWDGYMGCACFVNLTSI